MTFFYTTILVCLVSSFGFTQKPFTEKTVNRIFVDFDNGTLPFKKNGKWGLVDLNNEVKIPAKYDSVFYGGKNLCILKKNNNYTFVNEKFQILHNAESINFDFTSGGLTVQSVDSQYIVSYTNSKLLFFSTTEDFRKFYLKSKEPLIDSDKYHWEKTYSKINGIDTLYKVIEGDLLYVKVKFKDGREYVSDKSFQFNETVQKTVSFES